MIMPKSQANPPPTRSSKRRNKKTSNGQFRLGNGVVEELAGETEVTLTIGMLKNERQFICDAISTQNLHEQVRVSDASKIQQRKVTSHKNFDEL